MKIDLLYEIQIGDPTKERSEYDAYWQAVENGGPPAAVDYLTYAFKVFAGGFQPGQKAPEERGTREEVEAARAGSTPGPYRDMLKAYPLLPKMMRGEVTYEELDREDMVIVGDVDRCIEKIERYREVGVDRLLCLMQAGDIRHEAVLRSIELFGKHVVPRFDP